MQICIRPNIPDLLDFSKVPVVLNDEYGHQIKNVSKITFKLIDGLSCFVIVEYPEMDKKSNIEIERSRMFLLKGCKIDLSSIGVTEKQEKYHASLESACKRKIPWYVKIAMKVVNRFLEKKENLANAPMM